jgi:L-lactate utilization protein LutB
MPRCKFNQKLHCVGSECTNRCEIFRKIGQQTLGEPPKEVIGTKKGKGHTVTYYKVRK